MGTKSMGEGEKLRIGYKLWWTLGADGAEQIPIQIVNILHDEHQCERISLRRFPTARSSSPLTLSSSSSLCGVAAGGF